MKTQTVVLILLSASLAHSIHPERPSKEELEDEEKRPYHFSYSASRYYNGLPDREHQEERGADGITRGVYRYVDPRLEIQEVVYTSDDDGFHVDASNLPRDTPVVRAARLRHQRLFDQIKEQHARLAEELDEQKRKDEEEERQRAIEED